MTALRPRHLSVALAAALALVTPGCGGDDEQAPLLSQQRADTLLDTLDDAEQQFEEGECDELEGETLPALEEGVAGISNEVDADLRTALEQESQELQQLSRQCRPEEEDTTTAPPPEETVAPPPTETVPPTTTETVPPTTTKEQTTEEEPPPEDDGNEGEGNGGEGEGDSSGPGSGEVAPPGSSEGGPPPSAGGPPEGGPPGSRGSAGAFAAEADGGGT